MRQNRMDIETAPRRPVANFTVSNILFDGCTFQDDRMIREQPGVVLKDPKYLHIL